MDGTSVPDRMNDGETPTCGTPDRTCPLDQPYEGAPCEGELSCPYPDGGSDETWTFECVSGQWDGSVTCPMIPGASCPVPPLAEPCRDPFGGTVPDVMVELGPADEARPFEVGERVPILWGGQGSPMITYRMTVTGADELECVKIETTLSIPGETSAPTPMPVKLRCGNTLTLFSIIPFSLIEPRLLDVTLDVQVTGIGSAQAAVKIMGGSVPR
jgi:hypothetical protein